MNLPDKKYTVLPHSHIFTPLSHSILYTKCVILVGSWRCLVQAANSFEKVVQALGLTPEQYLSSVALKEWVRSNKDEKYVPPDLLKAWGFTVDEAA